MTLTLNCCHYYHRVPRLIVLLYLIPIWQKQPQNKIKFLHSWRFKYLHRVFTLMMFQKLQSRQPSRYITVNLNCCHYCIPIWQKQPQNKIKFLHLWCFKFAQILEVIFVISALISISGLQISTIYLPEASKFLKNYCRKLGKNNFGKKEKKFLVISALISVIRWPVATWSGSQWARSPKNVKKPQT